MANIFVGLYNFCKAADYTIMPPFFESFIEGLRMAGNIVLCFQTKQVTNRGFENDIPNEYREIITDFSPDLCILFNNNFWNISNIVDCPIVIYDVDSPLEYQNQDELRDNTDRYKFIVNQTASEELLSQKYNVKSENVIRIPFFSEIHCNPDTQFERNIGYIGTNWLWKGENFYTNFVKKNPTKTDLDEAKKVINYFTDYPFLPSHDIYTELESHAHWRMNLGDLRRAAFEISGLRRIKSLECLADLGLTIHGNYWTIDAMNYFPEVLSCVDQRPIWNKSDNEHFYNTSKIAVNTNHIQAQNGFSFRVCDILSSNACLVTEKCSDLSSLFPNVGIPMFESPAEAREKCIMLLNNENMRSDIVSAAHEVIDKEFRFSNVLNGMEDFLGLNLHTIKEGQITYLEPWSTNEVCVKKRFDDLPNYKKKYYNSIGKYLGYDPCNWHNAKRYYIWKISIAKVLYKSSSRKELYLGFIPLVSVTSQNNVSKINFILLEYFKKSILKLFNSTTNKEKRIRLNATTLHAKKCRSELIRKKFNNGERIKIVLFVCRIECWLFGDLYNLLKESGKFEPIVIIKPIMSRGIDYMKECMEDTYSALKEQGFAPIKGYDEKTDTYLDVRNEIDPDIVFFTKAWKPHFHEYFYISRFLDRITFLAEYGYDVSKHDFALNFDIQNLVDKFFLPSEKQIPYVKSCMSNHGANLAVTGSMKIERIFDGNYVPKDVWKPQNTMKKRIIWAPHHEDKTPKDMYQYDAFYDLCDLMFEIAYKYKDDIQIAFKPHPLLKTKLYRYWGEKTTEEYYQRWDTIENGQLETGEFIDLFLTSDAMILDSISFIAEYSATKKPSLFTVGSHSRPMYNSFGQELYEMMYHASAKENLYKQLSDFIENVVIMGNDILYEQRASFVNKYIAPPNNKTAAENVFDEICSYVDKNP